MSEYRNSEDEDEEALENIEMPSDDEEALENLEEESKSSEEEVKPKKRMIKAKDKKVKVIKEEEDGLEKADAKENEVVDVNALIDNLPKVPHQIEATLREVRNNAAKLERQFFV